MTSVEKLQVFLKKYFIYSFQLSVFREDMHFSKVKRNFFLITSSGETFKKIALFVNPPGLRNLGAFVCLV